MVIVENINSLLRNQSDAQQGLSNLEAAELRSANTQNKLRNALRKIQRRFPNVNIMSPGLNVPKTRTVYRRRVLGGKRKRATKKRRM